MLDKLIAQLGKELNITNQITSTEDKTFLIPLEGDIEVQAFQQQHRNILKAIIGQCPQANTEAFLMRTMEANLFGMGTRGGVIGLNDEGKLLTLSMELEYNSNFKDFKEKLEDFISVLDYWRNEALKHT